MSEALQRTFKQYCTRTQELISAIDYRSVSRLVDLLMGCYERGTFIFVAGNGGSAATALHFHEDLCYGSLKGIKTDRRFKALCLPQSVPYLTTLANDVDYSVVFREQMRDCATPGSLFLGITCSGNSPNILSCIDYAHGNGMDAFCLLGFDGGTAARSCQDHLLVRCEDYGIVEAVHSVVLHYAVSEVAMRLKASTGGGA